MKSRSFRCMSALKGEDMRVSMVFLRQYKYNNLLITNKDARKPLRGRGFGLYKPGDIHRCMTRAKAPSQLPRQHTLQRPRATLEPRKPIRATLEPRKPSPWPALGVASEDSLSDRFTLSVSNQERPFSLTTTRK